MRLTLLPASRAAARNVACFVSLDSLYSYLQAAKITLLIDFFLDSSEASCSMYIELVCPWHLCHNIHHFTSQIKAGP